MNAKRRDLPTLIRDLQEAARDNGLMAIVAFQELPDATDRPPQPWPPGTPVGGARVKIIPFGTVFDAPAHVPGDDEPLDSD